MNKYERNRIKESRQSRYKTTCRSITNLLYRILLIDI
ncbi:hypothetical protein CLOL250_02568 [Clostridium sp. L2-50]|nr:hypothetical protein CLOL250_02568 [Clostridium sp. L2-50]